MRCYCDPESWILKHLVSGYSWHIVGRQSAVVFDVGGGQGAVPETLAPATKNIKFTVQDMDDAVEHGRKALPVDLEDRIEFMLHEFFTKQPVKGADDYFWERVLHDWSNKCILPRPSQHFPTPTLSNFPRPPVSPDLHTPLPSPTTHSLAPTQSNPHPAHLEKAHPLLHAPNKSHPARPHLITTH